jgi:protein MAK11
MAIKRARKDREKPIQHGRAERKKEVVNKRPKLEDRQQKQLPQMPSRSKANAKNAVRNGKAKADDSVAAESYPPFQTRAFDRFQIIAGSYERLLYGLAVSPESQGLVIRPIFQFPAHLSCIKVVSGVPAEKKGGRSWLATGGTDESVKIWELRRRREVGGLVGHAGEWQIHHPPRLSDGADKRRAGDTGYITDLCFPVPKLLLTAAEDSTISLFRTKDWAMLKVFRGHKVNCWPFFCIQKKVL